MGRLSNISPPLLNFQKCLVWFQNHLQADEVGLEEDEYQERVGQSFGKRKQKVHTIRCHTNQRLPDVGNMMSAKHTNWKRANTHLGHFAIREELWNKMKRNPEFIKRKNITQIINPQIPNYLINDEVYSMVNYKFLKTVLCYYHTRNIGWELFGTCITSVLVMVCH